MDNPIAVRPREAVRRTALGGARSVRTELSASQSVTPTQSADALQAPAPAQDGTARDQAIDDQAYAVINSTKEDDNHEERAHSDDALLRQRAYAKPDLDRDAAVPHADIEV